MFRKTISFVVVALAAGMLLTACASTTAGAVAPEPTAEAAAEDVVQSFFQSWVQNEIRSKQARKLVKPPQVRYTFGRCERRTISLWTT